MGAGRPERPSAVEQGAMMRKAEAMVRSVTMSLLVLVVSLAASARAASPPPTLTLAVDASEAPRGIPTRV